ncbi:hypothetical protein JG688_00014852 [Phytophthora aleatoria]|uniref:Uncharacterized protein n=1 Tax=Phytophthora aleatoria TaxID=2496075 RepID=A0A8J5J057_9STRA|nr:hypothetical protein JG688_00014852 [Phytophthora aleatoria]
MGEDCRPADSAIDTNLPCGTALVRGFHVALNSGEAVEFTERQGPSFTALPEVASLSGARLSQMTFGNVSSSNTKSENNTKEDRSPTQDKSTEGGVTTQVAKTKEGRLCTNTPETVAGAVLACEKSAQDSQKNTEFAPKSIKPVQVSKERAQTVTWSFAERSVISGMTKAQRKRAQAKKDREAALKLAEKYSRGKDSKLVSFADVTAVLDSPYSMFHTKPMVNTLLLPTVEVKRPLSGKPFSFGKDIPVIKTIAQLTKVQEAIDSMKAANNTEALAYRPDFGCATCNH